MSEHSKKNVSAIEGEHKNRKRAIRHIVQSNHTFEVEVGSINYVGLIFDFM